MVRHLSKTHSSYKRFEVVLIIRTCALWGNNWKIKYFLLALFVSIFVPMAISVNLALDAFDCAFSN